MDIALVITNYNGRGGGAERWTDRHARRLLARGHTVRLVARRFAWVPEGAICHPVPRERIGPARISFARAAEHILIRMPCDVIHDMGDGWHADLFMPHHGTRKGGYEQNTRLVPRPLRWTRPLIAKYLPRYREFDALERRQYQPEPGKLFIAISKMVRDDMQRYYRVPSNAIRIVYNGVDTARFRPADDATSREVVRAKLGMARKTTVFLLVAHNFQLKGLDATLLALSQMLKAGANATLVVVGNGKIGTYRRRAHRLGCGQAVRFLGDQADPLPYFQSADVYVQPTYYDPCSLVVLEALACGLPVITTCHNGAAERIESGREGLILADPNNVCALIASMVRYLDPESRRAASAAARRCAERCSLESNTDQLVELYREVSERRRTAA